MKSLKIYLVFILLAGSFIAKGQTLDNVTGFGYKWQRGQFDKTFSIPADTFSLTTAQKLKPHIAAHGDSIYRWSVTTQAWLRMSVSGVSLTDTSIYKFDGLIISNRHVDANNHTFTIDNATSLLFQNVDGGTVGITKDLQFVTGTGGKYYFNGLSAVSATPDLLAFDHSTSIVNYLSIGSSGKVLTSNGTTASWQTPAASGITAIATANGFAGSGSPTATLSTTVTGMLKGNGTAISAATAGTDYLTPAGAASTYFPLTGGPLAAGAYVGFPKISYPSTPSAGFVNFGFNTTNNLFYINENGYKRIFKVPYPADDSITYPYKAAPKLADSTDVVSLAQTLTNKTLTSPVINVGSDATGDMYYRNSSGALVRIPAGTASQTLHYVGGIPTPKDTAATLPSQWTTSAGDIYYNAGNVAIGYSSASGYNLRVAGQSAFGSNMTVYGDVSMGSTNTADFSNAVASYLTNARFKSGGISFFKGSDAAASLVLEVTSTTKAVAFPRMTTTQKNAISSPVEGSEVYDLTLHQKSYYNGTTWINY